MMKTELVPGIRPLSQQHHVLVIDDDLEMRSLLSDYLRKQGHRISMESSATEALQKIKAGQYANSNSVDLIISDINMPGISGLEFLAQFHEMEPLVPVIIITAFGSIESAIDATRKGAFNYIVKPFKLVDMGVHADRALQFRDLHLENKALRSEIHKSYQFQDIIGKSSGMQEVFDLIQRVSQTNANVLISGESGTGKERVARAIHDLGPRAGKHFVAINCTAIPETLLESELFGHAKGSFTGAIGRKKGLFEEADGGTVFLDEIGDMDLSLQAKLLRVIQERKIRSVGDTVDRDIDVRIIAATHKDLKSAIRNGSFREDLFYRLSVIPIVIPPLRHRREDIPLLANHFLRKYAASNNIKVRGITPEAMEKLMNMAWEGNVRELENVMERAVVLCRSEMVDMGDLPKVESATVDDFYAASIQTLPTMEDLEKRYIKFVLQKTGGRKEKAAQILGVNRRTLYRKEREYGFVDASPDDGDDDYLNNNDTH